MLTGKYNDDPTGGGGRIHSANWGALEEHKLAIAREVAAVAGEIGATASQVALRWVQAQSPTMIPVIGSRKASQIVDNLKCVDVTLSPEHLDRLDQASKIELGFPYDFITGGRRSWLGDVVDRVDDHRGTVV